MVLLISSDNVSFTVDKEVVQRSTFIKNMLEDVGDSGGPIVFPNITSIILQKVVEYCEYRRGDPADDCERRPGGLRERRSDISAWDERFLAVDQDVLFDLIIAANYLDIQRLIDIGCMTVAKKIKGKSPDEIRKIFNIVNDFTPEEEAEMRKENEWAANV
ncbi:S-phase kinase-associated protein 1A-like protein [Mycena crocata]|nr:S-phase kinase-associated protein 1A-like protein [Mycena crocata]